MVTDPVQRVLRMKLDNLPVSIRQLAREAGISHVVLVRARDGHERLSPAAVRKVVIALRRMGTRLESVADALEKAANERD